VSNNPRANDKVLNLISSTAPKVDGQGARGWPGGEVRAPGGREEERWDGSGCREVERRWLGHYDRGQCHWPTAGLTFICTEYVLVGRLSADLVENITCSH
jgi:hypothetical protein